MESLCFCGSGKPHRCCHGHINENSIIARLYRLQNDIGSEMGKQITEKQLKIKCRAGCSECCSQCFCVSEAEFVQILDFLIENWPVEDIEKLVQASKAQWDIVKAQYPEFAQQLQGPVSRQDVYQLDKILNMSYKLPFSCVFLDENKYCSIYNVRPLVCRVHGASYTNLLFDYKPCSEIPSLFSNIENFADLTDYADRIISFIFLKYNGKVIVRRPYPLFYFFVLLFGDTENIRRIADTEFYNRLIRLDEDEYISGLANAFYSR